MAVALGVGNLSNFSWYCEDLNGAILQFSSLEEAQRVVRMVRLKKDLARLLRS